MYKSIKIYTRTRCQVSVYRTTGPLVKCMEACLDTLLYAVLMFFLSHSVKLANATVWFKGWKQQPCGGRKTSPRKSTIVQFIFYFGPLRSAIIF